MEIYNEKEVTMMQLDCGFSEDEVRKFTNYYYDNCPEKEMEMLEINWAVTDILKKKLAEKKKAEAARKKVAKAMDEKLENFNAMVDNCNCYWCKLQRKQNKTYLRDSKGRFIKKYTASKKDRQSISEAMDIRG